MKAKKKTAGGARKARGGATANQLHIGVRVTPELAAALETMRAGMLADWPGATVTISDVVRMTLRRAIDGTAIRVSPLAERAAFEGAAREGTTPSAYVERLLLAAIPEAD